MLKLATFIAALLFAVGVLTACGGDNTSPSASPSRVNPSVSPQSPTELELPISVAVTLPLFEDFVREVGRENVVVLSLVPAGVDPHSYELTAGDVDRLRGVDFFFVNGLALDRKIQEVVEARRDETAYLIPFAPNIRSPRRGELGNPELTAEQARDNAHLWLDPAIAAVYAEIIADEFIIYDGIREDFYTLSFSAYKDEMLALVQEIEAQIQTIPEANRKLVTHHDSFAHFARKFGLEVVGSAVTNPGNQAAAADIDRLVQAVRDQGIPAVFSEYGYDAAAMETIASAAGVEVCTLQSDIQAGEGTIYIEMMRANVAELVRCLGGSAPQ
jgi:ABC-type Zn uptake system ZnuABC Zn-binding protein ZnuA